MAVTRKPPLPRRPRRLTTPVRKPNPHRRRRRLHRLRLRPQLRRTEAAAATPTEIAVRLPDIGDFADIPVIEVLVGPGDSVDVDQSILTLESDKATMEIPCPAAGTVQSVAVKVGDKLNQGDLVLTLLGTAGTEAGAADADSTAEELEAPQAPAATPKPDAQVRAPGDAEQRKAPVLSATS